MSRSQCITTEECFTPEQRDFFRACSEMAKFTTDHPKGYAPFGAEASRHALLEFNLREAERNSGLELGRMHRFCQHYKIIQFDYDNPQHRDLLLPEIVALNETRRLQHLSQHDYGRVMKKKSQIIASFNGETESLEHGLTIGSTVVSFFAAKTSKIIHLLAESIGLGHKEGISKAEVDVFPEYWETVESQLIPKSHFTPQAQAQASVYYAAHLESTLKKADAFFHCMGFQNPASPETVYNLASKAATFAAHMRTAGSTFNPRSFHTSKNSGLTQLAYYLTSPKDFIENADSISRKTLEFIHSDSPEAAAFTEQTLCRFQMAFLDKMQRYSEFSADSTLDFVTELMDRENIPQNARSLYYQQVLSVLPIKEDLSIDQIVRVKNHAQVKQKFDELTARMGDLQKHADRYHAQTTQSLNKIKEAVQDNAAAISELKQGQKELIDFLKDQKTESDKLLKKQQKEQQTQQEIDGYQKFGQFLGMWGDVAQEPILKDAGTVCMAGTMAYQAYTGFSALAATAETASAQATAAALASGATAAGAAAAGSAAASGAISFGATLGPVAMAGMAALMVIGMLMKKDQEPQSDEAHKQIMQALQQIMSKLDVIHKQMHERFDLLDKRLDKITELMLQGFDAVLFETKKIVGLHLQGLYAAEKLAAKVDSVTSKSDAGFEAIQSTLVQPTAIQKILKPPRKDFLRNLNLNEVDSLKQSLLFFLTETSCSPRANASDVIVRHNGKVTIDDVVGIADELHDQSDLTDVSKIRLRNLLGLLAGLANHHVGSDAFVPKPESLLNPNQWRQAIVAYEKLLTDCNPALGADKELYIEGIHDLSKQLEKLKSFLIAASTKKELYEKLVGNYHQNLSDIQKLIQEHLQEQEIKFYEKHNIQPGERLLPLDMDFNEASQRLSPTDLLSVIARQKVQVDFWVKGHLNDGTSGDRFSYTAAEGLSDPNIRNPIDPNGQVYDGHKIAWNKFSTHFGNFISPAIQSVLTEEDRKLLFLAWRFHLLSINKSFHFDWWDNCAHERRDCSFQLQFQDKELMLVKGNYTCNTSFYDRNRACVRSADLQHASWIFANWNDREPCSTSSSLTRADINDFISHITVHMNALINPYRALAIRDLLMDVKFKQALEKLESSALQIHSFMNLLQIDPKLHQVELCRAARVLKFLSEAEKANPSDSLRKIKTLQFGLSLRVNKITTLLSTVDITTNALYRWAKETAEDLGKLETKVNAWTDAPAPAESDEVKLLRATNETQSKKLDEISKKLDAVIVVAPKTDNGYETDRADEPLLEKTTRDFLTAEGHAVTGALWEKPAGRKAGERKLRADVASNDELRLPLYHFLRQPTKRSADVTQEANPDDSTALFVQLAVRKKK